METADWIALVGIIAAVFAIAVPPVLDSWWGRRDFRATVAYRIDEFATISYVVATQAASAISTQPSPGEGASTGSQDASQRLLEDAQPLLASVIEKSSGFAAALTTDARHVMKRLERYDTDAKEVWHAMVGVLPSRLSQVPRSVVDLLGIAQAALGAAAICISVLGLQREDEWIVQQLRFATMLPEQSVNASNNRAYVSALLPPDLASRVLEPTVTSQQ